MSERRLRRVEVLSDIFEEQWRTGATVCFHAIAGLPDDAVLIHAGYHLGPGGHELVFFDFASRTFTPVPEGELPPPLHPTLFALPFHPTLDALRRAQDVLKGVAAVREEKGRIGPVLAGEVQEVSLLIEDLVEKMPPELREYMTGEKQRVH